MGFKILKRGIQGLQRASYDDVDSLIVTVGVIATLVLSFSVGLQYAVPASQVQAGNFRQMVCDSNKFRGFVLDVMKEHDVGTYKYEPFSFVVSHFKYQNKAFDIRDVVNDIQEKYGEFGAFTDEARKNAYPSTACREDKYIQMATRLLVEVFPMDMMETFILHEELEMHTFSAWMEYLTACSSNLLMLCVLMSVVLYVSLALSPSREDETNRAMKAWLRTGWVGVGILYVLLIAGIVAFYVGNTNFLQSISPFAKQADQLQEDGFQQIWIPVVTIFVVLAAVGLASSCRSTPEYTADTPRGVDKLDTPGTPIAVSPV